MKANFSNPQAKRGLLLLGLVAAVALAYYVFFYTPKDKLLTRSADEPSGNGEEFPLARGSRGTNVRYWQEFLYANLYSSTKKGVPVPTKSKYVDGIFGPNTERDTETMLGATMKQVDMGTFLDAMDLMASAGQRPEPAINKLRKARATKKTSATGSSSTSGASAAITFKNLIPSFQRPQQPLALV